MNAELLAGPAWEVAPRLLGWRLESRVGGHLTAVTLTEIEAYDQTDPASHSFNGPTRRNMSMFGPPGRLYVYRSYGLHWCANVTTGPGGHGAAVLLRAGIPTDGSDLMRKRRGRVDHLADGPGKLTQALGITGAHDGSDLFDQGPIRLIPGEGPSSIHSTARIGITRGRETPWRFLAPTTD